MKQCRIFHCVHITGHDCRVSILLLNEKCQARAKHICMHSWCVSHYTGDVKISNTKVILMIEAPPQG